MRPIDADKFEAVSYTDTEGREDTFDEGVRFVLELIDKAPTVDAIPIEYIESWKRLPDTDAYNRASVDWLIRDWRKENETD